MRETAVSYQLSAVSFGVVLVLSGCAATRSGPSKSQAEYAKAHSLSPDDERRLYAREVRRGDAIELVRVIFDGCELERTSVDGDISVWKLHVPIDERGVRVVLDKIEEIHAGGAAMLTFRHDRLESALVLE